MNPPETTRRPGAKLAKRSTLEVGAGALPATPRAGRLHLLFTVAFGLLVISTMPVRPPGRLLQAAEFAVWSADTSLAAISGFASALAPVAPQVVHVFALPSLVAVALVWIIVESRLIRRVRIARVGGLYGP